LGAALAALLLVALAAFAVVAVAHGGHRAARPKQAAPAPQIHKPPRPSGSQAGKLVAVDAAGNATIRRLALLGLPIYCAGSRGSEVGFTFDDGPGPYTHYALKKLTDAGERATFFVVGRSMDYFPGWLRRELKVATIGDHTYTHPVLTALSTDAISSEIERTKRKIQAGSGQAVDLFRPPYGARDTRVDAIARKLGLLEIIWNVESGDSVGADWAGIIRNVEAGLHPGAIILMHENRGQTIRALTTLLPELHRRHLRSVSLPELFATDAPSVAQVRRGRAGCGPVPATIRGNGG
jgi:peptidoglycan/xylan/chitin deacetylase (PgdA/CDA1 family)